ncbi:MAG: response regulator [Clostridia bacterium]
MSRAPSRILVVDDELDTAQSLAVLFRAMGKQVEFAVNAKAALDIAQRLEPEMVFVDIGLPDIDGWELAKRLQAQAAAKAGKRALRVVVITGRAGDEERQRSEAVGAEAHLVKPVDPAYIEKLVTSTKSS